MLTLGSRLYIIANFGTLPYDSFCIAISSLVGISVGTFINLFGVLIILFVALIAKSKPDFKVIISSLVFGLFFDFWGFAFQKFNLQLSFYQRMLVFLAGLIICTFGTAVYLLPKLSPSALDHLMMGIKTGFSISIAKSRNIIEVFFFVIALLLKGPIGVATIIIVLVQGIILQFFYNRLEPAYQRLVGDKVPD